MKNYTLKEVKELIDDAVAKYGENKKVLFRLFDIDNLDTGEQEDLNINIEPTYHKNILVNISYQ